MSLLRPRVADDRGQRVRLASMVDVAADDELVAGMRRARSPIWRYVALIFGGSLGLLAASLAVVVSWRPRSPAGSILAMVIPLVLLWLWASGVARWARVNRRRLYTRLGRCQSCLQPLQEQAAEADGCTVCPECGAAWRLEPADGRESS